METATLRTCYDCGVAPGNDHLGGCDVAVCAVCGLQWFGGSHAEHGGTPTPWDGEWPGAAECRRRGWYAVFVPGSGWRQCDADAPGASEDLDRLRHFQLSGEDTLYPA